MLWGTFYFGLYSLGKLPKGFSVMKEGRITEMGINTMVIQPGRCSLLFRKEMLMFIVVVLVNLVTLLGLAAQLI